ncbi:transcriptional regulator with XRE-family HTH domain [Bartonella callosciuri]|uniref:Transcriptional regulator with XRE-family HTH domain n=1 Tax=Bartonella callosciuri TaxID=686223 RepID=A0A840NMR7_9HYPH|nr:transcriptional regulator with XRE-family HTH domain [Bartonella callosciuri]
MQTKNPHNDIFVGKRIRFKRKMLKMSQKQLCHALSVSFQQVQKYETRLDRIGAGCLKEIADILNVPIAFFMRISEQNKSPLPSWISNTLSK